MKVGIITFQETNNYGAILQNYALQQALIQKGHHVRTIDYRSSYIGKPYRLAHLRNKGFFPYAFGVLGYLIYMPRRRKCKKFRKRIRYTDPVKEGGLGKLNEEFDLFITGSDQVWNPRLTGMDAVYMLNFVADKVKCNSYAASIGLSEASPSQKEFFYAFLHDFHYISVREKSAATLLGSILGREVAVASDPCLLLTREEWASVAEGPRNTQGYVFVYQLGVSSDAVSLAKRIAREESLRLVFVPFPVGAFAVGRWDVGVGNAGLVGYIMNAEYVVTDSFHGTLLSIIFNKKFFTKISGTHAGVSSRIYDLLERYGLEERIIQSGMDYGQEISYESINDKIKMDREMSMQILDRILQGNR